MKNMLGGHGTYVPNMLGRLRVKDACCQNTLLMGDLNGRTKNEEDYVRDLEDKHCPADTPIYTRDLVIILI